tara:strand:+ start:90 stop:1046 length:957 start_codon:yes stop_codon:yes gene_type:complete
MLESGETWVRAPIRRIEDLADGVKNAGLEAMQMSRGALGGSLAFAEADGVTLSSGLIGGDVALRGPLSSDQVTFGFGLQVPPGARHWLRDLEQDCIGVFMPGDEHDALYPRGAFYATATLSLDQLQAAAAEKEIVLERRMLGGSGFHPKGLPAAEIASLRRRLRGIHAQTQASGAALAPDLVGAAVRHYGRAPRPGPGRPSPRAHARIVARAREHIMAHLDGPITLADLASAAGTSQRTLQRAFASLLGEPPRPHIRRIRLHRIRRDLASEREAACSIALIAERWGVGELGRFAGRYREMFGERPSDTRMRMRAQSSA